MPCIYTCIRGHGERTMNIINKEHAMTPDGDLLADEKMGGEIGETIKNLRGKQFPCTCHHEHLIKLETFTAYPHEGGLADKDGKKWWLYVTCPLCNYDWSWWKVQNRLERQNEEKT